MWVGRDGEREGGRRRRGGEREGRREKGGVMYYFSMMMMLFTLHLQFEGENAALSNMNSYLTEAFEKFK